MAQAAPRGAPMPVVITDVNGNLLAGSQQVGSQVTTISDSTSETTIVTAGATGIYNVITGLQITNQTATAVTVTIKDSTSGTTRKIYDIAANGGIVVQFPFGLQPTSATANWTATLSVNTVVVDINVDYVQTGIEPL